MDRPLLSICIPTYNRKTPLTQCLERLVPMVQDDGGVEIIISDNASPDGTKEVVERYAAICPNLKYFRNEANFGFDRNVLLVAERASGEFVWFVGDDDLIVPGSIEKIKDVIRHHPDLGLIHVNFQSVYFSTGQEVRPPCLNRSSSIKIKNPNAALRKTGYQLGFLSSLVARRASWLKVNSTRYGGSGWLQLGIALAVMTMGPVYLMADVCINSRYVGWDLSDQKKSLYWWQVNFIELDWVIKSARALGYNWLAIGAVLLKVRWRLMKSIAFLRMTRHPLLPGSFALLASYYKFFPFFWLIIAPLYVMPRTFLQAVYNLRKSFQQGPGA